MSVDSWWTEKPSHGVFLHAHEGRVVVGLRVAPPVPRDTKLPLVSLKPWQLFRFKRLQFLSPPFRVLRQAFGHFLVEPRHDFPEPLARDGTMSADPAKIPVSARLVLLGVGPVNLRDRRPDLFLKARLVLLCRFFPHEAVFVRIGFDLRPVKEVVPQLDVARIHQDPGGRAEHPVDHVHEPPGPEAREGPEVRAVAPASHMNATFSRTACAIRRDEYIFWL